MTAEDEQPSIKPEPRCDMRAPLRLGFGCAGAWALPSLSDRAARRLVAHAASLGVSHFDTAGFYGAGAAEARLGRALADISDGDACFVSTKTGTRLDRLGRKRKDFSEAGMRADVDASLRRLGRERIDLLYLHGPSNEALERAAPFLDALKDEGLIAAWGVCGEGSGLDYAVDRGLGDAIMGVYNVFDRRHADVFRRAKRAGMAVAAIAPLAQALYRKDFFAPRSPAAVWYILRALVRNRAALAAARAPAAAILHETPGWDAADLVLRHAL
ncbi:MAG: aldo/keto reductase, partial [Pseudomonadota bacterium]